MGDPPAKKKRYAVIDEAGRLVTRTSSMVAAHRASRRSTSLASRVEANRTGEDEQSEKFGEYTLRASQLGASWDVDAYLGDKWVGSAQFGEVRGPIALKGWDVRVEPDHRRRGLASAMYAFAKKAFKLPIQPGDFQTPEGEAFLKGRAEK